MQYYLNLITFNFRVQKKVWSPVDPMSIAISNLASVAVLPSRHLNIDKGWYMSECNRDSEFVSVDSMYESSRILINVLEYHRMVL